MLGALVLVVVGILFFGGTRIFERTQRAVINFEGSIAGLDVGAPVTFRGVRVGSVQRVAIRITAAGRARIPVIVELVSQQMIVDSQDAGESAATLERLVENGLRAQLAFQSVVTGQLRIDLDFRPGTPADVQPDSTGLPEIPALPSDLERLREMLSGVPIQDLAQTAQRALQAIESLAQRLDTELGPLLSETRQGITTATRALDTTAQTVTQLRTDASQTLQELNRLIADTRQQLDNRSADLARVLTTVDKVGQQTQAVLNGIEDITAPRSRLRSDLEAAARDLAASAGSLRGFARTIERDPSAVLRGRSTR
ncbi:MAG: MlaD family protein [Gammaproteobacteria bacterium]